MADRLSRRHFGLALLAPLASGGCRRRPSAARPQDGATSPREKVELDVSQTLGPFERLSGVQGSPAPIVDGEPERVREFRTAGIQRTRFPQDCLPNTLTLGGVFPNERADPDTVGSYRFEAIDRHVRAARAAGAKILWQSSYDVGGSDHWEGLNLGGRPPADLDRWTKVVTRCLDHFNASWANGFERAVDAVEFVNEPNGLGGFRGDDAKRLQPAFVAFLDAIEGWNRAHPAAAVRTVGPGIPLSFAEWPTWRPRFETALLELAKAGKTLPVFSFHTYGDDVSPSANEKLARALRELLDRNGMKRTELWNTEWQAGDYLRKYLLLDDAQAARATKQDRRRFASAAASYVVACKLRWQGVVSGSCSYRANRRAFPPGRTPLFAELRSGESLFFHANGSLAALGLQEKLLGLVAEATSERCATQLADDGWLTVAGLRSEDGRKVSVVASNLDTRPRDLEVRVRGLSPGTLGRARVAVLDEREDLGFRSLPAPPVQSGERVLSLSVAPLATSWFLIES